MTDMTSPDAPGPKTPESNTPDKNTPLLGFIDAPGDRVSNLRGNRQWLEEQLARPDNKMIVFVGERPAISVKDQTLALDLRNPQEMLKLQDDAEYVLLHRNDQGQVVFALQLDEKFEDQITSDDVKLIDLRSLAMQAVLPSGDLGTLAQARSLLSWHSFHRFCSNCGGKTAPADAGYRRDCPSCQRQHFPRVDPVVIMLVQHGDKFLMGRGHNFVENRFSALAGFLEPGETIEAATRRETFEETGIEIGEVRYLISQPWPFPSSLMIGVVAQALTTKITLDDSEIAEARWFSFSEVRQMLTTSLPDGTSLPPPMSIAYQMMQGYLNQNPIPAFRATGAKT